MLYSANVASDLVIIEKNGKSKLFFWSLQDLLRGLSRPVYTVIALGGILAGQKLGAQD